MSDQYIGEIRYFPYIRGAPTGWLTCDGSLQSISNYQVLYTLLGTTYGGDGQNTFGLPDLRGRIAIGASGTYPLGSPQGAESVTLTAGQIPSHTHAIQVSTANASGTSPSAQVFAAGQPLYVAPPTPSPQPMAVNMAGSAGQNGAHENCGPTLAIRACIATEGEYPPRP